MDSDKEIMKSENNTGMANTDAVGIVKALGNLRITYPKEFDNLSAQMRDVNNAILTLPTPKAAISTRPGADGQTWEYIYDDYFKRLLNLVAPIWGFVLDGTPRLDSFSAPVYEKKDKEWVNTGKVNTTYGYVASGRIVLQLNDTTTRQVSDGGSMVVKFSKAGEPLLDAGYKGAVTDCFKRCCVRLGFATDVYGRALAQEDHFLIWSMLSSHLNPNSPNTQLYTDQFFNAAYEKTQIEFIRKLADEIIPLKVAEDKKTDKYKGKPIDVLYQMARQWIIGNAEIIQQI